MIDAGLVEALNDSINRLNAGGDLADLYQPEQNLPATTDDVADHLQRIGLAMGTVYHSGKARAEQTARIFAERTGAGEVHERAGMNPNDDAAVFAAALPEGDALFVGHLPHLQRLASYLLCGDPTADVVALTNAGVLCLNREGAGFRVAWYLTPGLCGA